MAETCGETVDPRSRRTRELLQQALAKLLISKEFEKISVHDIAAEATVNRATFYAHYPDKFALLEAMVAARFHELLDRRGVRVDGGCAGALTGLVLGVCDYLASQLQMEPHMESAVIGVVRWMMLDGLKKHAGSEGAPPEMIAAAVSWAIFGAAKEWVRTPERCSSEEIAPAVVRLVSPMLPAH